jgi:hypothetical protein
MAIDLTYTLILKEAGDKTFTMPSGFESNVEIHCWGGGGGGSLGVSGGGGGYASTVAQIPAESTVRLQIGQPGANGGRGNNPPSPGGTHPSYIRYRGGSAGSSRDEDADMGSGGGGGGASAVVVDNSPVCVGAGGGGAGGPGDDSGSGTPGNPGGVFPGQPTNIYPVTLNYAWCPFMNDYAVWGPFSPFTTTINFPTTGIYTFAFAVDNFGNVQVDGVQVVSSSSFTSVTYGNVTVNSGNRTVRVFATNTGGPAGVAVRILKPDSSELTNSRNYTVNGGLTATSDGGNSVDAWASGGGGGGGYYGGLAGTSYGDDSGNAPGGNGGQNYGNITIAGSGALPGGLTTTYYPTTPTNIGRAGYPGYIIMIFTRKPGLQIKNADGSGDWVTVNNSYTKVPTFTYTVWATIPPTTINLTSSSGIFTVPPGVYSLTLTMIGGGGNGNANTDYHPGPGGGSAAYFSNVVVSVTPGQAISYSVGAAGASNSINPYQSDGTASTFGALSAGGGRGGHWRGTNTPYPSNEAAGEGGVATGAGGVNGTAGNNGNRYGGNGFGASSPYGIGGAGTSSGAGGRASGYGAGGGGGGNNSGQGSGSPGLITLSYSSAPVAVLVTTGGWKEVQQLYTKVNGAWKSISQKNDIILYNYK